MAGILLDHNVSRDYLELLTGHVDAVRSARDEHLDRADDSALLVYAAERGWVIVTHDSNDFWLLHRAWHRWAVAWHIRPMPRDGGVLVLPQRPHLPPEHLVSNVVDVER